MLRENMIPGLKVIWNGNIKFIIDFKRMETDVVILDAKGSLCVVNNDKNRSEGQYASNNELEPYYLSEGINWYKEINPCAEIMLGNEEECTPF